MHRLQAVLGLILLGIGTVAVGEGADEDEPAWDVQNPPGER